MDIGRWAAFLAACVGGWIASACVVRDDPEHCANREGDATCVEVYGPRVFCSTCERFYNGCVDGEPDPGCRVEDEGERGDGPSSEGSDGSSSEGSDGEELACETCTDGPDVDVRARDPQEVR